MPRYLPQEEARRILAMRDAGMSLRAIGAAVGREKSAVARILRTHGRYREAARLWAEGRPIREIAKHLGVTSDSAKNLVTRARSSGYGLALRTSPPRRETKPREAEAIWDARMGTLHHSDVMVRESIGRAPAPAGRISAADYGGGASSIASIAEA